MCKFRPLRLFSWTLPWHFVCANVVDTDTDTCSIWCIEWYVLGFVSYLFFGVPTNENNQSCLLASESILRLGDAFYTFYIDVWFYFWWANLYTRISRYFLLNFRGKSYRPSNFKIMVISVWFREVLYHHCKVENVFAASSANRCLMEEQIVSS